MIKNLLRIAVLITCTVFATHALAFGGLLEKLNDAIVGGIFASSPNTPEIEQKDRLLNLIDKSKLKFEGSEKILVDTSSKKLAIIKSVNVDPQIKGYQHFIDDWSDRLITHASNGKQYAEELDQSMTGDAFFKTITKMLSSKFRETIYVQTIEDGFSNGADYVAVIDIKLAFTVITRDKNQHVLNVSTLFIDKNLNAAPDVVVNDNVEEMEVDSPSGNIDEDFRLSFNSMIDIRKKTYDSFEKKLNSLVIYETDDPPVAGITLTLSGKATDESKPSKKRK